MNITVYLGASSGNDPTLESSVRALGRLIGKSGNALVYGGSKNGLMGALAESVLRAGGEVAWSRSFSSTRATSMTRSRRLSSRAT